MIHEHHQPVIHQEVIHEKHQPIIHEKHKEVIHEKHVPIVHEKHEQQIHEQVKGPQVEKIHEKPIVQTEVERPVVINEGTERVKTIQETTLAAGAPVIGATNLERREVIEEKEHRSLGTKIKDALGLGKDKE